MNIPPGINLTTAEKELLASAEKATAADPPDPRALHDLTHRLRKAKEKYTSLYRRQGAARVGEAHSRGVAAESGQRTEGKAEVFAEALDQVEAAQDRAESSPGEGGHRVDPALAEERIAAARAVHSNHGPASSPRDEEKPAKPGVPPTHRDTTSAARDAAIGAAGSHNQQAKDHR